MKASSSRSPPCCGCCAGFGRSAIGGSADVSARSGCVPRTQPLDRLLDLLDRATDEFLQFTPWGLSGGYYYARVNYTWGR